MDDPRRNQVQPVEDRSSAEAQRLAEKLQDIQTLTDAALSGLGPQGLLDALVDRVRHVLRVDTAAVLLLDASAAFLVATAASGLEQEVNQGIRIPVGHGFAGRIAAEGRPVILSEVDHSKVVNPLLLRKGVRSLLGVPLRSGGRVLGVLHVGTLTPRAFSGEDVELLQLAADRAASAVEALSSHLDRAAAAALQRSLLPSGLPAIPGLRMAARFVPGRGNVGGDWYDVFVMPTGQLCAVIGDVAGSGLRAAATMGRMRSALRAYALETTDPAEILERLERKMAHFEPDAVATVLCGVFSLDLQRIQFSNAGHMPPVIASEGAAAAVIPLPADTLIGAPNLGPRRVTTIDWPEDSMLCLYTDGLVERRDLLIDEGIAHLRKVIKYCEPDDCCVQAMTAMADVSPPGDDIALLVLQRVSGEPDTSAVSLALPLPASLQDARVHWSGQRVVVTLPKEIDATNATGVFELLASLAARHPEVVVADLADTIFCDSAGLNSLIRARRAISVNNGELRIALGSSPVSRIIELSGIAQVIPVFADVDQSLSG
ncbi:MAG TPA: SpoIIE family protein phosphatase [Streptosporangiaceae bacterium]|nr:SpoIIE family protein phosphatase [Streptosporangiaceae bacterium]